MGKNDKYKMNRKLYTSTVNNREQTNFNMMKLLAWWGFLFVLEDNR